MKKITCVILFLLAIGISACKKEAGEGGNSTIKGKVQVHDYNGSFPALPYSNYGAQAEDVYIIYGDGTTADNRTKTSFDGSFEFQYLRKGTYKIFVYSDDSNFVAPSGKVVVQEQIEITKNKSEVIAPDMLIIKL